MRTAPQQIAGKTPSHTVFICRPETVLVDLATSQKEEDQEAAEEFPVDLSQAQSPPAEAQCCG
ncbi:hypothetical protein J7E90_31680 [Streptomyces sp. ISL-111]|uniref:hypothetical protein n=1 Tax=unclassified Streptomyces TaxID=2593676 RepID=UPI001BEC277E|nr:hypothetical protein [Streptomyces sp. ISL-111]MBT2429149.1 hypothetical protein [Streptomyces sp. ISL-112]MBT2465721.1 hypothetical protein [Streptomyces sp. ISL-63]